MTDAALKAARDLIRQLQRDMRDDGFYTGQIDGIWGGLSTGAWEEMRGAARLRTDVSVPMQPPEDTRRRLAWGKHLDSLPHFKNRPGSAQLFRDRVFWIADELQMHDEGASDLMSCMAWENDETFSSSIVNKAGSGATGLIQFMPATALPYFFKAEDIKKMSAAQKAANGRIATGRLAAMNPEDQLNYVYRYFSPWKGRLKSIGDIYMAILWPAGVGQPDSFPLWDAKTRPTTYRQNAGLDVNKDKVITRGEAVSKVLQKVVRGHEPGRLWVEAA